MWTVSTPTLKKKTKKQTNLATVSVSSKDFYLKGKQPVAELSLSIAQECVYISLWFVFTAENLKLENSKVTGEKFRHG